MEAPSDGLLSMHNFESNVYALTGSFQIQNGGCVIRTYWPKVTSSRLRIVSIYLRSSFLQSYKFFFSLNLLIEREMNVGDFRKPDISGCYIAFVKE